MKKSYLIFGIVLSFVLVGCGAPATQPSKPKIQNHSIIELNDNAKKVLIGEGTMVNCRVLGQIDGMDQQYKNESWASYKLLDENAKNDFRNNASVFVKDDRLISARVLKKEIECWVPQVGYTSCGPKYVKEYKPSVKYVKYIGEVLDCGER